MHTVTRQRAAVLCVALLLLSACAAQTAGGKAREALLYNQTLAQAAVVDIEKLHQAKAITEGQYQAARQAYESYRLAHNGAVQALVAAEKAGNPTPAQLAEVQLRSTAAATDFINLAASLGAFKQ